MKQEIKKRIEEINSGIVPEGYEKTDFGIFPSGWDKKKTYSDLFDFSGSLSLSREELGDNGYPYLHYGDMHRGEFSKVSYKQYCELPKCDVSLEKAQQYLMKDGDIVFLDASEDLEGTSRCVLIDNEDNKPFFAGLHTIVAKEKNNNLSKYYKQYITQPQFVKKQFARLACGFKVYGLNKDSLGKIKYAYPIDTKEQTKIAEILMKWDDAITLQEQYIQKLEERRKVLLNQIIVNKIENREKKYTELGSILQVKGGYAFKSENYIDEGKYKIITIKNVQQGQLDLSEVDCINDIPKNIQKWQILEKGDLIISLTGNVGRTCFVNIDNCLLNQRVGKIVVDERLKYFVYSIMQTKKFIEKIKVIAQGGAQANISNDDIEEYGINLPYKDGEVDYETIDFISNTMKLFDEKLLLEKEKLEKLKLQRKAMQQYLLTGVVRVSV